MSSRLRVGLVLGEGQLAAGGVRSVALALSQGLARRGHAVRWLALERGVPGVRDTTEGPWSVRRLAVPPARDAGDLLSDPAAGKEVLRWCASEGLDLVHLQHLSGLGLGLPATLSRRGVPVVATLHDAWTVCPRGQLWHAEGYACERAAPERCAPCVHRTWPALLPDEAAAREHLERREALVARALASCARLLTPTAAARDLLRRHGAPFERVEVLANPVLAPAGPRGPRERRPGELRLGVLGSVQPSKGVLELARVVERLGAPLVLEVHGAREPYHGDPGAVRTLEALAARCPRVELHAPFPPEALGERLAGLDAVCVPSLWEEFHGLVAVEARLAGLPVLVSGRGGLSESGGLVVGESEAAWEEALAELVRDPERVAALAALAAPADLEAPDPVDELVVLYRSVLAAAAQASSSSEAARAQE